MSDNLYLSPPGKRESEIPFFVVFESPKDPALLTGNLQGRLESNHFSNSYEFKMEAVGPVPNSDSFRYMGEFSLVDPGSYQVSVEGLRQSFEVVQKSSNLNFMSEFGLFAGGTFILLVIGFCWLMITKKKRPVAL